MKNYVVKITNKDGEGIYYQYFQTDDIQEVVKHVVKGFDFKIKPKGYYIEEYSGHRCQFHNWECTKGISILAHEVFV